MPTILFEDTLFKMWGYGPPKDSLGINGQIYIEVNQGLLYGKENGKWKVVARFNGMQYATGN